MSSGNITVAFQPTLNHLNEVLRGMRAGRASPALVEGIEVEAYGSRMRLKDLARIGVPDARTLQVEPWDKAMVPAVEKALAASALGITPVTAGASIRLPIPALTEERRQELTKIVRAAVEDAKVSVRNVREKVLKEARAKKDHGELSEDAFERERKRIQEDVDAAVAEAEKIGQAKEADILSS